MSKDEGLRFDEGKEPMDLLPESHYVTKVSMFPGSRIAAIERKMAKWFYSDNAYDTRYSLKIFEGIMELLITDHGVSSRSIAAVLDKGAKKYAPRNWEKGMPYTKVYKSVMRHLDKIFATDYFERPWCDSESLYDNESGLPHSWHVACNLMFLYHYVKHGVGTDDRPNVEME